jgi:hypothetical protein
MELANIGQRLGQDFGFVTGGDGGNGSKGIGHGGLGKLDGSD